jgi:hypothetical protein
MSEISLSKAGLVSTSSGPARESVYEPRSRSDYRRGRRRSQWYCNLAGGSAIRFRDALDYAVFVSADGRHSGNLLESKPRHARKFYYYVLSAATILGVCLNFVGMNPIRALFYRRSVNGVAAVPVMFLLMLMPEKPAIVGKFVFPRYLRVVGWVATGVILVASLGFLVTTVQQLLAR